MCYLPGHSSSSVYDRLRIANSGHHSGVKVILSFILYLLLFFQTKSPVCSNIISTIFRSGFERFSIKNVKDFF